MEQRWEYDYHRVYPTNEAQLFPDLTNSGSIAQWYFSGVALEQDYYTDDGGPYIHISYRVSRFQGGGLPRVGSYGASLGTWIAKAWNGDWATGNRRGLADCKNP